MIAERSEIGREFIQISTPPGLRISQGSGARAGVKIRITHQTGPQGKSANLAFEVLDLIEIACPVKWPLGGSSVPPQSNGVSQAFPELSEIPNSSIVPGIVLTRSAAKILLKSQAGVAGVIEVLLAQEHRWGKLLLLDTLECSQQSRSNEATH